MGYPRNSSDPAKLWLEVVAPAEISLHWLAARWLQSYLIFLLTNMGNLWLPALPSPGIFFQKQVVNLEIYIECTRVEKVIYVFIFVRYWRREWKNWIFFLELFYLWRDGWRGECFLGNPVWLEFLFFSHVSNFQRIFKRYVCIYIFFFVCICMKRLNYFTLL